MMSAQVPPEFLDWILLNTGDLCIHRDDLIQPSLELFWNRTVAAFHQENSLVQRRQREVAGISNEVRIRRVKHPDPR